jgi:hypothetical protein
LNKGDALVWQASELAICDTDSIIIMTSPRHYRVRSRHWNEHQLLLLFVQRAGFVCHEAAVPMTIVLRVV